MHWRLVQALKSEHSHGFSQPFPSLGNPVLLPNSRQRECLVQRESPVSCSPTTARPLLVVPAYGDLPRSCLPPGVPERVALSVLYSPQLPVTSCLSAEAASHPGFTLQKWGHTGCPMFSHMKCYQKASSPSSCIWPLSQDTFLVTAFPLTLHPLHPPQLFPTHWVSWDP